MTRMLMIMMVFAIHDVCNANRIVDGGHHLIHILIL